MPETWSSKVLLEKAKKKKTKPGSKPALPTKPKARGAPMKMGREKKVNACYR